MKKIFAFMITLYQLLCRPFMPRACRFYPSCSDYTKEAILQHGAFLGTLLGIVRILRCGPWSAGGFDPVPKKFTLTKEKVEKSD